MNSDAPILAQLRRRLEALRDFSIEKAPGELVKLVDSEDQLRRQLRRSFYLYTPEDIKVELRALKDVLSGSDWVAPWSKASGNERHDWLKGCMERRLEVARLYVAVAEAMCCWFQTMPQHEEHAHTNGAVPRVSPSQDLLKALAVPLFETIPARFRKVPFKQGYLEEVIRRLWPWPLVADAEVSGEKIAGAGDNETPDLWGTWFPMVPRDKEKPVIFIRYLLTRCQTRCGRVFLHPTQAWLDTDLVFGRTFEHAPLALAFMDEPVDPAHHPDVMVTLHLDARTSALGQLKGASGGVALALALYSLWTGQPLETGPCYSMALVENPDDDTEKPDGRCHRVWDIEKKLEAWQKSKERRLYPFFVATEQSISPSWINNVDIEEGREPSTPKDHSHLQDVFMDVSPTIKALQKYLRALCRKVEVTKWKRDDEYVLKENVQVPMRVLRQPLRTRDEEKQEEEAGVEVPWESVFRKLQDTTLEELPPVFVVGGPGSGKSFRMEMMALELARSALDNVKTGKATLRELVVPLHVVLNELANPTRQSWSLEEAIVHSLTAAEEFEMAEPEDAGQKTISHFGKKERKQLVPWLRDYLSSPCCWLILDAMDQVASSREPVLRQRFEEIRNLPGNPRVIVTCRKRRAHMIDHLDWLVPEGLFAYKLCHFNDAEQKKFIGRWFEGRREEKEQMETLRQQYSSIQEALPNPLLATLIALQVDTGTLDTRSLTRTGLFRGLMRDLILKNHRADSLIPGQWQEPFLRLLRETSWYLFQHKSAGIDFSERELRNAIRWARKRVKDEIQKPADVGLERDRRSLNEAFLFAITDRILEKTGRVEGNDQFNFLHKSFLEYLGGAWLADEVYTHGWDHPITIYPRQGREAYTSSVEAFVRAKAWDPDWELMLRFMAGSLVPRLQVSLLELFLNEPRTSSQASEYKHAREDPDTQEDNVGNDYLRRLLSLAALCLSEMMVSNG